MSSTVFDHQTANVLRAFSPGTLFRFESGDDAFSLALRREGSVLLVPAGENGMAAVLQMRRAEAPKNAPAAAPIRQLLQAPQTQPPKRRDEQQRERDEEANEPRGILGLDGDAVYLDEEELEKQQRSWWQRLFRG